MTESLLRSWKRQMALRRKEIEHVDFVAQGEREFYTSHRISEILECANRLEGRDQFRWRVFSSMESFFASDFRKSSSLAMIGSHKKRWHLETGEISSLLHRVQQAERICLVGSATLLLADLNLHCDQPISVFADFCDAAKELGLAESSSWPPVQLDNKLGTAVSVFSLPELILRLIGQLRGVALQDSVAANLGLASSDWSDRGISGDQTLLQCQGNLNLELAVRLMQDNIEEPLTISDIAIQVGMSIRNLERMFSKVLNGSPSKIYRDIRLDRSKNLLIFTKMPLVEVSIATGFGSSQLMQRHFEKRFGISATELRRSRQYVQNL